jgi:predicted 3-demethylubiquinone-9 3-methyltransferase (glyoxalase superfamily)
MAKLKQRITPFLWFDDRAEEAAKFYVSVFPNSKITSTSRYDEATASAAGRPPGTAMTVAFQLDGQDFVALNGGPHFTFTEAVSFVVNCESQAEIDHYWSVLTSGGGQEVQCGWLKDRFGLSWQVVPAALEQLLQSGPEKASRVMAAIMKMKKLDVEALTRA